MCDVYVYMHKHERLGGSGGMLPQEIRFSEIASEAIFGQKQSCSSYMARRFVCCINFVLAQSTYALPMPAEFEFPKVDRAAGGVTSQEGQLVNSRPPEVLFTHIFMRILSSQVCNGVNSLLTRSALVIHEQTAHTASTRLIWMAVIFNSCETIVDYFQMVGHYQNV